MTTAAQFNQVPTSVLRLVNANNETRRVVARQAGAHVVAFVNFLKDSVAAPVGLKIQGGKVIALNRYNLAALAKICRSEANEAGYTMVVEVSSFEARVIHASTNVDFSRFLPVSTFREVTGYIGGLN